MRAAEADWSLYPPDVAVPTTEASALYPPTTEASVFYPPKNRGKRHFLLFTDVHINLDFPLGCTAGDQAPNQHPPKEVNKNPFATDGCDAPISLLQLAADTARSISPKPEMALVAGDLVWHGTGKEGPGGYFDPVRNKYTFVNTTYEITKHLQLPSCVALGNNCLLYTSPSPRD